MDRYSRQVLLPQIGVQGQQKILQSSVLIIGAGGLGAPCAAYLAGAGVGTIGLVDWDHVEEANLHRQITHSEHTLGQSKVESMATFIRTLNSNVQVRTWKSLFQPSNAMQIISETWDVVVDASDNVPTRYLANDCCVRRGTPLVSASALRWEGHLTVWGGAGPCYRCVFPQAPPAECVVGCGTGGVLGPVTGMLGSMQALEVIKLLIGGLEVGIEPMSGQMLLFNGALGSKGAIRMMSLRGKQANCIVCSPNPTLVDPSTFDYETFCGGSKANDLGSTRLSWAEYHKLYSTTGKQHQLVDVRDAGQFEAFHLPHAVNIPLEELEEKIDEISGKGEIVCVCRRGVASQRAVAILKAEGVEGQVRDIVGGMSSYEPVE